MRRRSCASRRNWSAHSQKPCRGRWSCAAATSTRRSRLPLVPNTAPSLRRTHRSAGVCASGRGSARRSTPSPHERKKGRQILIKMQQRLLTLFEQIHRPFVQRLITLLVSGLIALLLGGAFLLAGHGAFVTHLTQGPVSTVIRIVAQSTTQ